MSDATLTLRPYQEECCQAVWSELTKPRASIVTSACVGSGKSVMLAFIAQRWFRENKGRVLVVTHVKEIIEQDYAKLMALMPGEVGIYSTGLNSWDTQTPIIVAGIQTLNSRKPDTSAFSLVIVDEAHLVGSEEVGMYRTLLKTMPEASCWGLTGTPWRMQSGRIYGRDRFFSQVCGSVSILELVNLGYLARPVTKVHETADLTSVTLRNGDYATDQQDHIFSRRFAIKAAVQAIARHAVRRKSLLIFTPGCASAHALSQMLIGSSVVTGETSAEERKTVIDKFRNRELRYLINVGVFTTGFDTPSIDCIVLLRKTKSTSLLIQMVGRGLRQADGKQDCLVLDYAGNFREHPPLPQIMPPSEGKDSLKSKVVKPGKVCERCEELNAHNAVECIACKWTFPVSPFSDYTRTLIFGEPTQIDLLAVREKRPIKNGEASPYWKGRISRGIPKHLLKVFNCKEKTWRHVIKIHIIGRKWSHLASETNMLSESSQDELRETVTKQFQGKENFTVQDLRQVAEGLKQKLMRFSDQKSPEDAQRHLLILGEFKWLLTDVDAFIAYWNWGRAQLKKSPLNSEVSPTSAVTSRTVPTSSVAPGTGDPLSNFDSEAIPPSA